jgi:hypothetical protein
LRQLNNWRILNKNAKRNTKKNIGVANIYTKTSALPKTLAHPKTLAFGKNLADAKNLAHPKS